METRILLIFDRIASATTPACQSGLTYCVQALKFARNKAIKENIITLIDKKIGIYA